MREGEEVAEAVALAPSLVLPPELDSPSRARRFVREVLTGARLDEAVDAAELAVTELVTNAALHARTGLSVTVLLGGSRVRVEVRDGSTQLPDRQAFDVHATTGRGLALVGALAADHGVLSLGDDGKVVWFELDGTTPEPSEADLLAAWDDAGWDLDEATGEPPEPPAADDLAAVVLLQVPATLWMAARRHHDALLRELVLYLAEHDDVTADLGLATAAHGTVTTAVGAAVEQAQRDGQARPALPEGHPSPLPWVPPELDVVLSVAPGTGPACGALQDALDVAERLAAADRLLVRPGLPEVVAVRDWVCEQVQSQLLGVAPSPWGGVAQPRFETEVPARASEPTWDLSAPLASGRGVVAADDANRILGISDRLAAALGWRPEDLLGRRVVALIPPRLREGHVSGFTRHLTTGEAHVLGVPLVLPVLHTDGSEVRCSFLVEQVAQEGGRALYLAWIEPLPVGDRS